VQCNFPRREAQSKHPETINLGFIKVPRKQLDFNGNSKVAFVRTICFKLFVHKHMMMHDCRFGKGRARISIDSTQNHSQ